MYQTGSTSSLAGVLDVLATFLGGVAGWTVDAIRNRPSDATVREIIFHNAAGYFAVGSSVENSGGTYFEAWDVRGATGYSAGDDSNAQPGTSPQLRAIMSVGSGSNPPAVAPDAYFFFADSSALYVVVAVAPSDYQVVAFQTIDRQYAWAGGTFVGAYNVDEALSYWAFGDAYNKCWFSDANAAAYLRVGTAWKELGTDFGMLQGGAPFQPDYAQMRLAAYRPLVDGRAPLPYVIWLSNGANNSWPCGVLRRCVFLPKQGLSPRQVIQVGSTDYMVFPARRATGTENFRIGLLKD